MGVSAGLTNPPPTARCVWLGTVRLTCTVVASPCSMTHPPVTGPWSSTLLRAASSGGQRSRRHARSRITHEPCHVSGGSFAMPWRNVSGGSGANRRSTRRRSLIRPCPTKWFAPICTRLVRTSTFQLRSSRSPARSICIVRPRGLTGLPARRMSASVASRETSKLIRGPSWSSVAATRTAPSTSRSPGSFALPRSSPTTCAGCTAPCSSNERIDSRPAVHRLPRIRARPDRSTPGRRRWTDCRSIAPPSGASGSYAAETRSPAEAMMGSFGPFVGWASRSRTRTLKLTRSARSSSSTCRSSEPLQRPSKVRSGRPISRGRFSCPRSTLSNVNETVPATASPPGPA